MKYQQQIINRESQEEKDRQYQAFYKACLRKMDGYSFHDAEYFERKPHSDDREHFRKAIEAAC